MVIIKFRVLRIGILSLLLSGTIACTQLFNLSSPIEIARLTDLKKEENNNKTVSVRGTVGKRIAFLDSGAYQIEDESGSIWVYTTGDLPKKGEILQVIGTLETKSIPIAERELGETYIKERDRAIPDE